VNYKKKDAAAVQGELVRDDAFQMRLVMTSYSCPAIGVNEIDYLVILTVL